MSEEIIPKNEKKNEENSPEILQPEERARKIQSQMIAAFSSGRKSDKSILFEKMSSENITQYLSGVEENDKRQFEFAKSNRLFYLAYVIIGIGAILFLLIYLFPRDRDLFLQILGLIISFGGGFGIGRSYKNNDEN